jgi:hypothetical protein
MTHGSTILLATACAWLCLCSFSVAEVGVIRHRDGTDGHMTHLGDDIGLYSDSHGSTSPLTHPTLPAPDSHGDNFSGPLTPFGTPAPPNNLTPAPTLPMNPNRPLAPQQPVAPSPSSPPRGFMSPGGGGRFGR